jgi:hypothetical protein
MGGGIFKIDITVGKKPTTTGLLIPSGKHNSSRIGIKHNAVNCKLPIRLLCRKWFVNYPLGACLPGTQQKKEPTPE